MPLRQLLARLNAAAKTTTKKKVTTTTTTKKKITTTTKKKITTTTKKKITTTTKKQVTTTTVRPTTSTTTIYTPTVDVIYSTSAGSAAWTASTGALNNSGLSVPVFNMGKKTVNLGNGDMQYHVVTSLPDSRTDPLPRPFLLINELAMVILDTETGMGMYLNQALYYPPGGNGVTWNFESQFQVDL